MKRCGGGFPSPHSPTRSAGAGASPCPPSSFPARKGRMTRSIPAFAATVEPRHEIGERGEGNPPPHSPRRSAGAGARPRPPGSFPARKGRMPRSIPAFAATTGCSPRSPISCRGSTVAARSSSSRPPARPRMSASPPSSPRSVASSAVRSSSRCPARPLPPRSASGLRRGGFPSSPRPSRRCTDSSTCCASVISGLPRASFRPRRW